MRWRERRKARREKREREGNVIPPPSPPFPTPHTAMVMVWDVYITLQLGRYIYCPPSHLSIIDFPQQPYFGSPSQVKLQSTDKVGITQKKDLKRSGNPIDPAPQQQQTKRTDKVHVKSLPTYLTSRAWKMIVIRPDLARRSKHCQVDYTVARYKGCKHKVDTNVLYTGI